jgi:prepilin-type N-terminal cleavage/methylation domain-containing protein
MVMNRSGFTLIELLAVITIFSILTIALSFEYVGWQNRYEIESQVKELYNDLMEAKIKSMQRNRSHFVVMETDKYTTYEDTDPAPDGNGTLSTTDDTKLAERYNEEYNDFAWNGGDSIEFTSRGLSISNKTICIFSDDVPDYDCVVISPTRINLGKLDKQPSEGGSCASSNCNVK